MSDNMKRTFLIWVVALCSVLRAAGQSTNHIGIEELRNLSLPDVTVETATHIVPDSNAHPHAKPHVQLDGIIGGHIHFELLLPDSWNGRYIMGGGGGFVGTVQNGARDSVNLGYATIGTDTGHQDANGVSAAWALDNVEAKLNFGYLAVHRTAEVGKAVIRSYYGTNAVYSYFLGCSRGGGQAMMEAQRFPKDFDGIVAGAPAFDWTGLAANAVAIQKVLYPDPKHLDQTALDVEAMKKLQQAILDQCDAQDGLKDGVVQDPPSTHFDLAKVPELTDPQRKAIEAIYAGSRDDKGLIYPGYTPGAECDPGQWVAWIVGPVPGAAKNHMPDLMFGFGTQIFKYLIFNDPDWDYSTYDYSNFKKDTRLAASFLNATNADLAGLKARKGKLILWHGWADPALPAQATIDYYRKVQALDPKAAEYCRLFMVPGCLHCGGGPGASEVDWRALIVDWVEHGNAPERVIARKTDHGKLEFARPLFGYPTTAIYKGNGDPSSADSFIAKEPPAAGH
jgi:Tannase and feruloyl esterase